MDHGSRDSQEAEAQGRLIAKYAPLGVVATPHFYPHVEPSVDFFLRHRELSLHRLRHLEIEGLPKIYPAAEVLVLPGLEEMEGIERLTVKGTRVILLELPTASLRDEHFETVERIRDRGLLPLMAHIDRYPAEAVTRLLETEGLYYQLNAGSLLFGRARRFFRRLSAEGRVAALGSDLHGVTLRAYRRLVRASKALGPETLALIEQNSRRLLAGAECAF